MRSLMQDEGVETLPPVSKGGCSSKTLNPSGSHSLVLMDDSSRMLMPWDV